MGGLRQICGGIIVDRFKFNGPRGFSPRNTLTRSIIIIVPIALKRTPQDF